MDCSVTQNLEIIKGAKSDYMSLSHYHYRNCHLGPYSAIFSLKGKFKTAERIETVGVIVYSMPTAGSQMRNVATGKVFAGLDKTTRLKLINKNFRTISRVIIEPRFRSLGLAVRLVRETMPLVNVCFVESLAVMGKVNPFFEKAGMTKYEPPESTPCTRLIEALGAVGIDGKDFIDPRLVRQKIDKLKPPAKNFIEDELIRFLQGFGLRRLMPSGLERIKFTLSKITDPPVYYLWKNPDLELRI